MSGSGFSHELRQRQTQSLVLAPQLRQSLKILQVAATDLRSEILEELQSNPTLEELTPENNLSLDAPAADDATPADTPEETQRDELDFTKEFEILGKLDEDWRDYMNQAGGAQQHTSEDADKRQHFFDSLVSTPSLQEHLLQQAGAARLSPGEYEAIEYLIGNLDERGFLEQSLADAALQSGLPLADMQFAATVLRSFDPPGIGSQSLVDCLLAQLAAQDRGQSLAARMVRDHFDLLARRRIPELARKLGASPEDIQIAIEHIGRLDPAPGRRFREDTNHVVEPDVTVYKDDAGEWVVKLNSDYIPRLRLSNTYRELIAKGTLSAEERNYLR
ncbi:MAG: RNA polymerase sigma-54 factor, partial [Opitutaceae bacterium]|nr:RNA polymerase sigma-54 factor [Opitutaceae bacterium]